MKICFFFPKIYPLFDGIPKIGGAELNIYHLSKSLSYNKDTIVEIIVGDYGQADLVWKNNIKFIKLKYFNLDRYTFKIHKILRRIYIVRSLLSNDADIFLTTLAGEFIFYLVTISKFIKRKKVVFRVGHDQDIDTRLWKIRKKYIFYCYKIAINYVDLIICQKEDQRIQLNPKLIKKSRVIPNGIPIPDRNVDFKLKNMILWVSRFDPMKRPDIFITLARKLPSEHFVMIMPNAPKNDALVIEINSVKNIQYLNYVKFTEIQNYFDHAKCFVNTSTYEGFPNSFIQAGIGHTPILSFNVNPDNILNRYKIGYFCENSIDRAIQFISNLNRESIISLGNNAYNYCREHHTVENTSKKYLAIFRELFD